MEYVIIGDSHTWAFQNHFKTVWIDKPTAHNIHKHKEQIYNNLIDNEVNLFLFGEIDCRIHLWYQHKKTDTCIVRLMFRTVKRYIKFILETNKNIWILSIPPPGPQGNYFNYPYYASYEQKLYIYFSFNIILEFECLKNNIPFINYYYDVVDSNLERKKEFIADDCHLNEKIIPLFKKRLNEKKNT